MEESLALYTTVYPGVEPYLAAWYDSVRSQTDQGFDLWVGVDGLAIEDVTTAMGKHMQIFWVEAIVGDTPAQLRDRAIEQIVQNYEAVVFVDSDDLLAPERVAAARDSLLTADVAACALRLINANGEDLELTFPASSSPVSEILLIRQNVFGLSNTAYRSDVLCRCLPIPASTVMVDWFLATCSWGMNARLEFDFTWQMYYRQHPLNMAGVIGPFTAERILHSTELVLHHYQMVMTRLQGTKRDQIVAVHDEVNDFYKTISRSSKILECYVETLNTLSPPHLWWSWVAHPELEEIWRN